MINICINFSQTVCNVSITAHNTGLGEMEGEGNEDGASSKWRKTCDEARAEQEKDVKVIKIKDVLFCHLTKWNLVCAQ
jgi:hypothetical protein